MRCCIPRRRISVVKLLLALLTSSGCLFLYHSQLQLPPESYLEPREAAGRQGERANAKRDILDYPNSMPYNSRKPNSSPHSPHLQAQSIFTAPKINPPHPTEPVVPVATEDVVCEGPWPSHPDCQIKMDWMKEGWTTDPCYATYGVDGSPCSFLDYLSQVERHCPPRPGHTPFQDTVTVSWAHTNYDLGPLATLLSESSKFDWILRRISVLWSMWVDAIKTLETSTPFKHHRLKILVHIGALSDRSKFKLSENADHGGPLGELVQWSDLLAALHILGHELVLNTELKSLNTVIDSRGKESSCPSKGEKRSYDIIFTDIVGVKQFKKTLKAQLPHIQCLFRVLDSFGTEPAFNFKGWKPDGRNRKQQWGDLGLEPRQFMTMYPHSPDNSFLGFVVGPNKTNSIPPYKKRNIALVYGKENYMWKDRYNYLDLLSQYFDVHATIGDTARKNDESAPVPGFVTNHGILSHDELSSLLQESKLFIGLGFPYEGPAPLEAIANGCFFLNPRFHTPLNRENTKFFSNKPTLRALSSQNPYTEDFIGLPYVHTVDIDDQDELHRAVRSMLDHKALPPYIPYEYTYEGFLERVAVYLEHQDYCGTGQWPPLSALQVRVGKEGQSCKDNCYQEGLVCEPGFFHLLNNMEAIEKYTGLSCQSQVKGHSVHAPSISGRACSVQETHLLLSCVGQEVGVVRLCPCRAFPPGQLALCTDCQL